MKLKYLNLFMSFILLFAISGCGQDVSGNDKDKNKEYSIKITNNDSDLLIKTNSENKCTAKIVVETEPAGYEYKLSSTDEATDDQIKIINNEKLCYNGPLNLGETKKINLTATLVDVEGTEHKDVKVVTVYNGDTPPTPNPPSQENEDFTFTVSDNNYFIVTFNVNKKNNNYYEKFEWNFGDGSQVVEDKNVNQTQVYAYKKPGTYNVTFKAVGGKGNCGPSPCGKDYEIQVPVTINEVKQNMLNDLPDDNNIYIAFYIIGESEGKYFKQKLDDLTGYPRIIRMQFRNKPDNEKYFNLQPIDGLIFPGYTEATGWSFNEGMYMQVPFYIYNPRIVFPSGGTSFDFENFAIVDPKVTAFGGLGELAFVRMNTSNSLKFNLTEKYDSSQHRNIAKFVVKCKTSKDSALDQCSSEFIGFEQKN